MNIETFYSNKLPKNHPEAILHILIKKEAFDEIGGRKDVVNTKEFLQLALLKLKKDQTFKAHKHLQNQFFTDSKIAQESWVVLRGAVEVTYYDLDDTVLDKRIITAGDLSLTLRGGHNYVSLEEDTLVLEFKTGPYFGQDKDKVFV